MHRHKHGLKPNAPFKAPARVDSTGNAFSVPATHGSSSQDRIDASSSRSAWPNGNTSQGPNSHQGGHNTYNRSSSSSHGGQRDGGWGSRSSGGNEGFGYGPSSHKTVSMVDDFPDSVETTNDKYGVGKARQAALQRDAPKLSPGKAKDIADAQDRMDNMHLREHQYRERVAQEDKRNREKREEKAKQNKLKEAADAEKSRVAARLASDGQKSMASLPSFRRTSTSSSTLARKPSTYSKTDKKREQIASAAERRQGKERGVTDNIEDPDGDSDLEVVRKKEVRKDLKGKGKQREVAVDAEDRSPRTSKPKRPPPKSYPPVDIDALLQPNKPVPRSSSGRESSPVSSTQSSVIDLADSPEKSRTPKVAPPIFEMSPSPEPVNLNALIEQERAEEEAKRKREEAEAEKRREREQNRIVLSADEEEDEGGEDSEEAVRRDLMEGSSRGRFSKTPDPLLWAEETRADPSTLCPFCSRVLPTTRSSTLSDLLQYLLARPDIVDYPTARNPGGKRLPVVQTASFCRLHEEEMVIIPTGIAKGWPTEIDWEALPKRIDRQLSQHLSDIITGKTPSPFFEDAKKEWETKGNKMKNLLSEYSSFDVEQPGYYGSRGHELIVATVTRLFVTQTPLLAAFRCTPLDPPAYIRRVLVPETAVQLIKADLSLTDDESAREVLQQSRAFGKALWQGGLEGKEAEKKFIKEEERRERKEEEGSQEAVDGGKDEGTGKEKVVMTEAEKEKEKKRERRKQEREIDRRRGVVAQGLSVTNQSDDDTEEGAGQDGRSTARRKPKVGNPVPAPPAPPAGPPTKRKPKQQLNSERIADSTLTSGSVKASSGGGRSSEVDSDDMEVTTIKRRKSGPKAQLSSPQVKRKPGASSTSASTSIPRSKALSSTFNDAPLPRVKAKSEVKTLFKTKSSPTSSSNTKTQTSKRPSAPLDSDSDNFEEEIQTDFKKKKGKVAAPWETKRGKRKGGGGKSDEDDSPPPDSDQSSSSDDDDLEVN